MHLTNSGRSKRFVLTHLRYMCIQPNLEIPDTAFDGLEIEPQSSIHLGQTLLSEAMRVRKGFNYVEHHTVWSILTSFFFFGSYFCLDRHCLAWFYLREATTLTHLMGLNEESAYAKMADVTESSRTRSLYWLLFGTFVPLSRFTLSNDRLTLYLFFQSRNVHMHFNSIDH